MHALFLNANALNISLADRSVQCVVTSPPYYNLRDYNISGQIGLEPTPDEYVANMVTVFREVKRVLKDDGVLWLNVGDSYNGNAPNQSGQNGYSDGRKNRDKRYSAGGVDGLKPKDLIGIPWLLAFALRADGWWLRQDIIYAKKNPMPESVKSRCTKSHEYIFLLSKSAKYYYDNEAIKEKSINSIEEQVAKRNKRPHKGQRDPGGKRDTTGGFTQTGIYPVRNKRDVWFIATQPTREAHFATFPEALVEPCILAGSKPGDVIFDPFSGSGTVAKVAIKHNRLAIGTELNLTYIHDIALKRANNVQANINF